MTFRPQRRILWVDNRRERQVAGRTRRNEVLRRIATDEAIATCGGDMRATIRAPLVAIKFLEAEIERQISHGFRCGVKPIRDQL